MSEGFSEKELAILSRYVTNTEGSIFALTHLPEVVKGALFSRYSRSSSSLRSLLLKEFIPNEWSSFNSCSSVNEQQLDVEKAQDFYNRILDGYGDDSIGELGGAHLAIENLSLIATKVIEDARIGGSPLEKSTRYVFFQKTSQQEYPFYKEPRLITSPYRNLYLDTCSSLFHTYSQLISPLTAILESRNSRPSSLSLAAYSAALRAQVLDCLRGLLPASTLTNMGVYGNGRFFEKLLQTLNVHPLKELQEIGEQSYRELHKVIPSFIRRASKDHRDQNSYSSYRKQLSSALQALPTPDLHSLKNLSSPVGVRLIYYDQDAPLRVAAALLFPHVEVGLERLHEHCRHLSEKEVDHILDSAVQHRQHRRQKSPRALEHAMFTFECLADFGAYRDLQRHRILTQERQRLSCNFGYHLPRELLDTPLCAEYTLALESAKNSYDTIAREFPEEAQYLVPMAYHIRWYFHVNLRSLQWLCELRSSPAGHPVYRWIAQELAQQVSMVFPSFRRFFKFVDFGGYELGRLSQEVRSEQNKQVRQRV